MKKYFVLDTNVLLHAPSCLLGFGKNTVVIPVDVIEELDKFMKRLEKQPVPVPVRIDLTDKVTVELFHEGEDNATIISVYEQGVVRARLGESSAKLISSYLKDPREKDQ